MSRVESYNHPQTNPMVSPFLSPTNSQSHHLSMISPTKTTPNKCHFRSFKVFGKQHKIPRNTIPKQIPFLLSPFLSILETQSFQQIPFCFPWFPPFLSPRNSKFWKGFEVSQFSSRVVAPFNIKSKDSW